MNQSVLYDNNKFLQLLRMVAFFGALLYLSFGFLFEYTFKTEDIISLEHRLFFAICFLGLFGLSYISKFVCKHMGLLLYILGSIAIFNLLIMGTNNGYDAGAISALLLVIPVMNFVFYRWKSLLYVNALMLLGIIITFASLNHSGMEIFLFTIATAVIGGVSFFFARRLLVVEQRARENNKLYQDLFHHSINGIAIQELIYDKSGTPVDYMFLEANSMFEKHTGLKMKDVIGKRATEVFPGIKKTRFIDKYAQVVMTGESIIFEQFSNHLQRLFKMASYSMGNNLFASVFEDITAGRQAKEKIEYLSFHDSLTGVYNRRFFEEELKRLDVQRNIPLTLLMIDINGLKLINDAFGHAIGDELIKKVTEVLQKECRSDDIIARVGGDEFVILLPKTTNEQTSKLVKRLSNTINEQKIKNIPISVSFGWASKIGDSEKVDDILKKAENSMYRNKIFKRNSYRYQMIHLIVEMIHEKSPVEKQHSNRVSKLSENLALSMGLSEAESKELSMAGLLHDIGKIVISKSILNKPLPLDSFEYEEIKRHPEIGFNILSLVNCYAPLADYILAHHERWDGQGYPQGLIGEDIPLKARILAVVEAYEVMTSDRPYLKQMNYADALKEIQLSAGTQFDPSIVRKFLNMMQ